MLLGVSPLIASSSRRLANEQVSERRRPSTTCTETESDMWTHRRSVSGVPCSVRVFSWKSHAESLPRGLSCHLGAGSTGATQMHFSSLYGARTSGPVQDPLTPLRLLESVSRCLYRSPGQRFANGCMRIECDIYRKDRVVSKTVLREGGSAQ